MDDFMVAEIDIWRAAALMTQCFRCEAAREAARCADELRAAGEVDGSAMWKRIGAAIGRLQASAPAADEATH